MKKQKQLITDIMNEDAKEGLYKKQTAVEWLEDRYRPKGYITAEEFNQAKEMEKQQIMDAYKSGNHTETRGGKVIFEKMEQYYNETYGGNK